jgi:hypothetical protein
LFSPSLSEAFAENANGVMLLLPPVLLLLLLLTSTFYIYARSTMSGVQLKE